MKSVASLVASTEVLMVEQLVDAMVMPKAAQKVTLKDLKKEH